MNKLLFITLPIAFLGLTLAGCKLDKPCPPDEFLGNITLKDSVKNAIPYTGSETLVFVREDGDSLLLTSKAGIIDTTYNAAVETPCSNLPDPQTNYFTVQQKYIVWQDKFSQSYFYQLLASEIVFASDRTDTIFADRLSTGFFINSFPTETGPNFIVSDRTVEDLPAFYVDARINKPIFIADTTFLGYSFTDIYLNNRQLTTESEVFVSRTQGLVAFRDRLDQFWVLKAKR